MNNHDMAGALGRSAWLDGLMLPVGVLIVALSMIAPRTTQTAYALIACGGIAGLAGLRAPARVLPLPAAMLGFALFGVYLALNAALAVDRGEAYGKVLFYWLLVGSVHPAAVGIRALDDQQLGRLAKGLLAGVAIGALYLAVEGLFGQPIKKALMAFVPLLKAKHVDVVNGAVAAINLNVLNRGFAVLSLLLWPALLLIRALLPRTAAIVAASALAILSGVLIFSSEHETSMLALIFSAVAFAGMLVLGPVMRRLILAGWLVATLLVVPLAIAAYGSGLHKASWIPETGRSRIILWSFTAHEWRKAPILGVGVASTKELDEQAAPNAVRPLDHTYPLRTGRHSHNIFMQTWYELGAVGALLLAAAGVLVLLALARLPRVQSAHAHASFVAAVLLACFSWGMWQTWFMAAYGIGALVLVAALEAARRAGIR